MSERLSVGDKAPDFSLLAADGSAVSLRDFRGRRVVVYFYPAAMTPGCTTQACDFRDSLASLQAAGVDVVGISPDPVPKLQKFAERDRLTFPLLSDVDKKALSAHGAWGEKTLYGKKMVGVIRSTFVVGPDGRIEIAQYNVQSKGPRRQAAPRTRRLTRHSYPQRHSLAQRLTNVRLRVATPRLRQREVTHVHGRREVT